MLLYVIVLGIPVAFLIGYWAAKRNWAAPIHICDFEDYAYSPNVLKATCVWRCRKCGKLKWREDFSPYSRGGDVHDMVRLASNGHLIDVCALMRMSRKTTDRYAPGGSMAQEQESDSNLP